MFKKLFILAILVFVSIPNLVSSPNYAFAQSVDTAWVRRYNGPANGRDWTNAIAVDDSGNVYVTGFSWGGWEKMEDYATIKYDVSGNVQWIRRYNGPGSSYDWANAIAVDNSGNVWVTGWSFGSDAYGDYATIKYYPNGDTAWVRRYDGLANKYDAANAIAIDNSGNVYVTGESVGKGTSKDYATIKYYPNGDTAWVRRYEAGGEDRAQAITIDGSSNVYVTGASEDGFYSRDYATIKYNSNGDTAWVRRYNGPGNTDDWAYAIAVDYSRDVYVVGSSGTVKYDSDGNQLWIGSWGGVAIALDSLNNVYVTGANSDYLTIKYYPNGDTAWVRRYNEPGNEYNQAHAIAVDGYNNAYVTGVSPGIGGYPDYVTIKYYPNGNTAWVRRYDGPTGYWDWATSIAVDDSSNVYVTGFSVVPETDMDYITIKYVQIPDDVKDETNNREKPSEFALYQNYPNPFNQATKIEFTLSQSGFVSLSIYDLLGRKIRTLVSENLSPGYKSVLWEGKDDSGKEVSSGIYFYRLKIGDYSEAKRLVLLK